MLPPQLHPDLSVLVWGTPLSEEAKRFRDHLHHHMKLETKDGKWLSETLEWALGAQLENPSDPAFLLKACFQKKVVYLKYLYAKYLYFEWDFQNQ